MSSRAPRSSRARASCCPERIRPRRSPRNRPPGRAGGRDRRARRGPRGALGRVATRLFADARPRAAALRRGAAPGRRHDAERPPGRRALGDADRAHLGAPDGQERQRQGRDGGGAAHRRGRDRGRRAARRGAARLGSGRGGRGGGRRRRRGRGPRRGPPLLVRARDRSGQDRRRARLRRGLAHRRHPDPHPPAQPGRPVHGRAAHARLPQPHLRAAAQERRRRAAGRRARDGRDLPVVRAQRRQGLGRLHDRDLRRGAHRAGREDERRDPPVARPGLHRDDGHRRADRAPRDGPVPDADVALRPGPGRSPGA